ncbi:hypothetical protein [Streptomyces cavernicola]|uniref:Uncharacterized protein n=1 Tax=Streptomyces cavernicola TaxID=3043613 RepID=A0ABT6S2U2_9ACTN|nr:hypothetical protein [Streptomyces sp. B-S-A6]MDI3402345.1 hypothetical protein [Streptomyces sp. B-S-A6]
MRQQPPRKRGVHQAARPGRVMAAAFGAPVRSHASWTRESRKIT